MALSYLLIQNLDNPLLYEPRYMQMMVSQLNQKEKTLIQLVLAFVQRLMIQKNHQECTHRMNILQW